MDLVYKNKRLILVDQTSKSYRKGSDFLSLNTKSLERVKKSYKKRLILKGLGYKCILENDILTFKLNFSHSVQIKLPGYITKVSVRKTVITFESFDKILLGTFCENIFRIRPVNIYQQKGFIMSNKYLRVKEINKKNKKN